jgi:hypothetical protein
MSITRKTKQRLLIGTISAGAIGLAAAGASAFTASNTLSNPNNVVGYGQQSVTGATVVSVTYGLSSDGTIVDTVTFVAEDDLSATGTDSTAYVGFTPESGPNTAALVCGSGPGAGVLTASATYGAYTGPVTTFTCTVSSLSQTVATIKDLDIAVD